MKRFESSQTKNLREVLKSKRQAERELLDLAKSSGSLNNYYYDRLVEIREEISSLISKFLESIALDATEEENFYERTAK